MNPDERKQLAKALTYMAKIYSFNLDQTTLSMMLDDLKDQPFQELMKACKTYYDDPKNERFPRPAKLKAIVNPQATNEALAKEAAARIPQAIAKFGWPNGKEAREFIGELGWRVVERFGGWPLVCESHGVTISPDTFYAQARDLAKSTIELGEAGILDQPIGLPGPTSVGELISGLAESKLLDSKK